MAAQDSRLTVLRATRTELTDVVLELVTLEDVSVGATALAWPRA